MTVNRLELDVPDDGRAESLLGGLLGGRVAHRADGVLEVSALGGASIVCHPTSDDVARLRRVSVAVDDPEGVPDHVVRDAPNVLGTPLEVCAATPSPTPGVERRGAAGVMAFDHVCFAVHSLRDAVELFRGLGGQVVFGGHNRLNGTLSSQVALGGGTRVELLEPTRDDAVVARYLDRFGPGMHHLTWKVADVPPAVRAAERLGFPVADTDLTSRRHWRETYLPPSTTLGLLIQLAWTDHSHDAPLDESTVAAILDGHVDSHDYTMQRQPT